ncbi:MAG: SDR family oxidoreductase, partial [Ilumatobacter sp.]
MPRPDDNGPAEPLLASVLVTGGGTGIGAALARELAARGCDVLVTGRRQGPLAEVAASSARITTLVGDVTDASHRTELATALACLRAPRAVFHGAGYFQAGLLDSLSADDWRRSFDINVQARWELSLACASALDGGRILFIGSDAGAAPRAGAAAYSIAQAASETLRRSLQAEWADSGIAVGAFKPGLVDTDMVRGFMRLAHRDFPARSAYDEYLVKGLIASARDVARFAAWLLLDVAAARFTSTDWDV